MPVVINDDPKSQTQKTTYKVRDGFYLHLSRVVGDQVIKTVYTPGELVELTEQEAIEGANQIELASLAVDKSKPSKEA
jgi:hypothetical protein